MIFSAGPAFSTTKPKVLYHDHNPLVFEFKLNSPKTHNALDSDMCKLMTEKLVEWHKNPG